jgi:hypothetical protein
LAMAFRRAPVPHEVRREGPHGGGYRWIALSELDANRIAEGAIFLQDA